MVLGQRPALDLRRRGGHRLLQQYLRRICKETAAARAITDTILLDGGITTADPVNPFRHRGATRQWPIAAVRSDRDAHCPTRLLAGRKARPAASAAARPHAGHRL